MSVAWKVSIALAVCNLVSSQLANVRITKIPSREIYSGQAFSLLCTATSSSGDSVEMSWYNGSDLMEETALAHISTPPATQSGSMFSFYSILEVSVALFQTSWYTCGAGTGEGNTNYDNIQIIVEDTGLISSLDVRYPDTSLYTDIPFSISCLVKTPPFVSLTIRIKWAKNGVVLPDSSLYDIDTAFTSTSSVLLSRLSVNESHPGEFYYTCSCEAVVNTNTIFKLTQSTPSLLIQAYPIPDLTFTAIPANGPKPGLPFTLACAASTTTNNPLELAWTDKNGVRVTKATSERITTLLSESSGFKNLSLVFEKVLQEDEGVYHCSVVLMLTELQQNLSRTVSTSVTAPIQVERIRITQFPSVWNVGDNAALMCYVQLTRPSPVPVITWRNSTGLVASSDTVSVSETTPITSSIVTSVLEFVSLQAQSQVYYCHALVAGAGGVSAWHHVKVNKLPQANVSITPIDHTKPISLGRPLSLLCTVTLDLSTSETPDITWQRGIGTVVTNSSTRTVRVASTKNQTDTTTSSVIEFSQLLLSDADEYTCSATVKTTDRAHLISGQASYQLRLQAPEPMVSLAPKVVLQNSTVIDKLTCFIMLTHLSTLAIELSISWNITSSGGRTIPVSNSLLSDVKVHTCNKRYSQEMIIAELPPEIQTVTCEASISIDNMYIDESLNKATLSLSDAQVPLDAPYGLEVVQTGSYWAEVQWTSATYATFWVTYGRMSSSEPSQFTDTSYSQTGILSQSEGHRYTSLLINLQPDTQYWYSVVARATPVGSPNNFTVLLVEDEQLFFSWQPPDKEKQNGNITGYRLHCMSSLGSKSILTEDTTVVIASDELGTNYSCSVSAMSKSGGGPLTYLQITTTNSIDRDGVGNQLPLTGVQFYAAIAGVVVVCLTIIICILLVAVRCYKVKVHKIKKRQEATIKASSSLYSLTRATLVSPVSATNTRYVPSDEAQRRWNQIPASAGNTSQQPAVAVSSL